MMNKIFSTCEPSQPRWLAQLDAHQTGDQEVVDSIPARSATFFPEIDYKILSMVIFPFPSGEKKGSNCCQLILAKECAQYWLTA